MANVTKTICAGHAPPAAVPCAPRSTRHGAQTRFAQTWAPLRPRRPAVLGALYGAGRSETQERGQVHLIRANRTLSGPSPQGKINSFRLTAGHFCLAKVTKTISAGRAPPAAVPCAPRSTRHGAQTRFAQTWAPLRPRRPAVLGALCGADALKRSASASEAVLEMSRHSFKPKPLLDAA